MVFLHKHIYICYVRANIYIYPSICISIKYVFTPATWIAEFLLRLWTLYVYCSRLLALITITCLLCRIFVGFMRIYF